MEKITQKIVLFFIIGLFFAGIFIAPGILVLVGRKRYLAWKLDREGGQDRSKH